MYHTHFLKPNISTSLLSYKSWAAKRGTALDFAVRLPWAECLCQDIKQLISEFIDLSSPLPWGGFGCEFILATRSWASVKVLVPSWNRLPRTKCAKWNPPWQDGTESAQSEILAKKSYSSTGVRGAQTAPRYNTALVSAVRTAKNLWKLPKLTQSPLRYPLPHVYLMEQIIVNFELTRNTEFKSNRVSFWLLVLVSSFCFKCVAFKEIKQLSI